MRTITRATDDLFYAAAEGASLGVNGYTYESMPSQKRHMSRLKKELNEQGLDETHPMHNIIGYKYGPDMFIPDADRTVVARDSEGKIAGLLSHDVARSERAFYLRNMRVLPEHQGNQIGENLIKKMAEHTQDLPYGNKYRADIISAVPTAVKFYQKLGANFPTKSQHGTIPPEKVQQLAQGQRPQPGSLHPHHEGVGEPNSATTMMSTPD